MTTPTPAERRAAIAKLCGLVEHCGTWWRDDSYAKSVAMPMREWLSPSFASSHDEALCEALCESILLRGLVRAGVLHGVRVVRFNGNPDVFVADPKTSWWGNDKGVPTTGATPIEAMVALANAHLDALDAKEKTE